MRSSYDVLIVTALLDELKALESVRHGVLDGWCSATDRDGLPYSHCTLQADDGTSIRVAAAWTGAMGETATATRAAALVGHFSPACIAMCGICAGYRGKVSLGDVIVADHVYSYDHGKLIAAEDERGIRKEEFYHDIETYLLPKNWRMDAEYFSRDLEWSKDLCQTRPISLMTQEAWLLDALLMHEQYHGVLPQDHPNRRSSCPAWKRIIQSLEKAELIDIADGNLRLTSNGRAKAQKQRVLHPDDLPGDLPFAVHVGPIATGKTVREDLELFPRLERLIRKTLGVEMEAAAIGHVAWHFDRKSIVVKAVSDHGDQDKDNSFRTFAATASAEFLIRFLCRQGARVQHQTTGGNPPAPSIGVSSSPPSNPQSVMVDPLSWSSNAFGGQPHQASLNLQMFTIMAAGAAVVGAPDADIDRAKDLFDSGHSEAADKILQDLKTRAFDRLTVMQRFRVLSNLAVIAAQNGRYADAGNYFISSANAHPEHDDAEVNRCRGEMILGNHERAWHFAELAFAKTPHQAKTAAIYIDCAPLSIPMEDILRQLPQAIAHTAEVAPHIAERLLLEQNYEESVRWARFAITKADAAQEFHSLWILGQALLKWSGSSDPRERAPSGIARERLKEACSVLGRAADQAAAKGYRLFATQARLSQANAADKLGDTVLLDELIDKGLQLTERNPAARSHFLVMRSHQCTRARDFKRAVTYAQKAIDLDKSTDTRANLACAMLNRNEGSDRQIGRREIERLVNETSGQMLEQCADIAIRVGVEDAAWSDAERVIHSAEQRGLSAAATNAYRAYVHHAQNHFDDSVRYARLAFESVDKVSPSVRRLCATALASVHQYDDATTVLEPLVLRDQITQDTHAFVHFAHNAQKDRLILDLCNDLRKAGIKDDQLLEVELKLLEKYDPSQAAIMLEDAISQNPGNGYLRVRRCLLGVRLHRPELTKLRIEDVPSAGAIDRRYVRATVEAIAASGLRVEAVDYAYRCLHRFPGDPAAHMALIHAIVRPNDEEVALADPTEVCVGCAVEYAERDERPTLQVIEHGERSFSDIIGPDNPVATKLIGHRVGDTVILAQGSVRDRAAVIRSLKNKYVYRFQDVISNWQIRFPNLPFFQQIRMETDPNTGKMDLAPIIRMLTQTRKRVEHIDQVYRGGCVSAAMVADAVGEDLFDTLTHLAFEDNLFINSGFVTQRVYDEAVKRADKSLGIVLDPTAIWTIHCLQIQDILTKIPVALYVVQPSLDLINQKLASVSRSRSRFTLASGDKLGLVEFSEEAHAAEIQRWSSLREVIEKNCKVVGALELSHYDAKRRQELEEIVGVASLHSMAAAKELGCTLWTDDAVVGYISKTAFDVERLWTHPVLGWLVQEQAMNARELTKSIAHLYAFGFSGLPIDAENLIEACRLCNWNTNSIMFRKNVAVLLRTDGETVVEMFCKCVVAIVDDIGPSVTRSTTTIAFLEPIRSHPQCEEIVRRILRTLPSYFRFNAFALADIQSTVGAWLRAEKQRMWLPGKQ